MPQKGHVQYEKRLQLSLSRRLWAQLTALRDLREDERGRFVGYSAVVTEYLLSHPTFLEDARAAQWTLDRLRAEAKGEAEEKATPPPTPRRERERERESKEGHERRRCCGPRHDLGPGAVSQRTEKG